ncbi:hypothetical protein B296_00011960 [Ensete ventricosum]|uniref:DELLA protein n=1 Tax=Ensete ventricosum TaxID=4639 RepID=A0A427B932_ENSVE|nr:hypothetical protein B296_00011960 [Ensete ventricosum]
MDSKATGRKGCRQRGGLLRRDRYGCRHRGPPRATGIRGRLNGVAPHDCRSVERAPVGGGGRARQGTHDATQLTVTAGPLPRVCGRQCRPLTYAVPSLFVPPSAPLCKTRNGTHLNHLGQSSTADGVKSRAGKSDDPASRQDRSLRSLLEEKVKNNMKRERQETVVAAETEDQKGKARMEAEDGGVDELLAALGYKIRSTDMADVAQKLEQLEMAMGTSAAANDDALLSHLASDAVHYNPSDLSTWVDTILSEFNAPSPPLPPPPLSHATLQHHFDLHPAGTEQNSTITTVDIPSGPRCPAEAYHLEPLHAPAVTGRIVNGSDTQSEVSPSSRDRKRMKLCTSPPSSSSTTDAATSPAALPVVVVDTQESGIRLVHALMACAEAVQQDNLKVADALVKQITVLATSQGGAMRKVAGYFAEALARRIYRPQPARNLGGSTLDFAAFDDMLHQHFYESCPYLKFAHFTANQAILEAFAGCRRVHVVDLGMREGLQWPALLQALALRPGGPPSFRLTGIGPPQPDHSDALQEVGWKLAQFADTIRVDFRYRGFVAASLADLEPYMLLGPDAGDIDGEETEAVAVNSVFELHRLLARQGALEKVLGTIRAMRPRIVTVVEQEANHNGETFLERFTEALHYYSTMFDSLEGGVSAASDAAGSGGRRNQVMSEVYLGRQICNVVACEGAERTERHEALAQWRVRMGRAGFEPVPIGSNAFKQASMLLALFAGGDGYRVEERDGSLTLGWHTRPLITTSAWRITSAAC